MFSPLRAFYAQNFLGASLAVLRVTATAGFASSPASCNSDDSSSCPAGSRTSANMASAGDEVAKAQTAKPTSGPSIFTKIINKEIPGKFLYEDDQCVALVDVNPQAPVHFLVIPRHPLEGLSHATDADEPLLGHLLNVARKVADQEKLTSGYRVVAGQQGVRTLQLSRNAALHAASRSTMADYGLRALGLNRSAYERVKKCVEADMDLMGAYEFVPLVIKYFCLHQRANVIDEIEDRGLKVVVCEKREFDRMDAVRFTIVRAQGKGTPLDPKEHSANLESLLQGPVEVVIVAGQDALQKMRDLVGPNDPQEARRLLPESLRGKFGGKSLAENGFHVSANRVESHEELGLLFPDYTDILKSKGYGDQVDQWLWTLWRGEPHKDLIKTNFLEISRYSGTTADRHIGFFKMIFTVVHFICSQVGTGAHFVLSLFFPSTPLSRGHPGMGNSFMQISPEEEERIARAALADELRVPLLQPFSEREPVSIRSLRKPSYHEVPSLNRVQRETGESSRARFFRDHQGAVAAEPRRPPIRPYTEPRGYSSAHHPAPQRGASTSFNAVSAADVLRDDIRNSSALPPRDRISRKYTEDVTDDLLDLHGIGELMD